MDKVQGTSECQGAPSSRHMVFQCAVLLTKNPKFTCYNCMVMTTWRCITGCAPDYLQELCHLLSEITGRRQLRSSVPCRYLLAIPQARTVTMQRRAFACAGPTSWNAVPESIRSTALVVSLATLKTQLKTVLFVYL